MVGLLSPHIEEFPMPITTDRPITVSVPEAGRILGIGRGAAYAAATNGQLPVIRIGKLLRVPVAALERMLDGTGTKPEAA
jgi:excisionase family DNA binding protein